jgi:hypothetical protein
MVIVNLGEIDRVIDRTLTGAILLIFWMLIIGFGPSKKGGPLMRWIKRKIYGKKGDDMDLFS